MNLAHISDDRFGPFNTWVLSGWIDKNIDFLSIWQVFVAPKSVRGSGQWQLGICPEPSLIVIKISWEGEKNMNWK